MANKEQLKKKLADLTLKRDNLKTRVKTALTRVEKLSEDQLRDLLPARKAAALHTLSEVLEADASIIEIMDKLEEEDLETAKSEEFEEQQDFADNTRDVFSRLEAKIAPPLMPPEKRPETPGGDSVPLNVRVPKLRCKTFPGKGKDKLEFKNFWTQFQNCIDACGDLSGANKLTYLRSYLDGYALQLISHLTINDDNYKVAQELLKEEYLDEEFIIDESFKSLLSSSPSQDSSFEGLCAYVNECRAITHDLQQ